MIENRLFYLSFYTFSIPDWKNKKKIILDSLPDFKKYKLEKSKNSGHGDNNHYTDYFENLKEPPEYASTILDCVDDEVKSFCASTQEGWNLNAIWFQSYEKYNNFKVHNHGIGGWSAVLYVEFDDEEHSATTFYSPHMSNNRSMLGQYETYEPKVKEGDLIIFPSIIQHEASTNMSNKRRTIISFNLK